MSELNNKKIVIFGGTGSIGTILAEGFLKETVSTLILVSNNEHELWLTKNRFKEGDYIHYVFCDIRDRREVHKIFRRFVPDIVINAAALKHVNYCEEFPMNTIKTNILGLENLLSCSNMWNVEHFLQISTDKAVEPSSVMGASKLIGERMCKQWNDVDGMRASCVRFGNVLESRGSLIPQIRSDIKKHGKAFLTDPAMVRYFISQVDVWDFVKQVLNEMKGGEIFIPKLEEIDVLYYIDTVLSQYDFPIDIKIVGKGKAEKLREKLYSDNELVDDLGWSWVIK